MSASSFSSYEFTNTDVHTGVGSKTRDSGGGGSSSGRGGSYFDDEPDTSFFYNPEAFASRDSRGAGSSAYERHDTHYAAPHPNVADTLYSAMFEAPRAPDSSQDHPAKRARLPPSHIPTHSHIAPHRTAIPGYSHYADQRTVDAVEKQFIDFSLNATMPLIDRSGPPGTATLGMLHGNPDRAEPVTISARDYLARTQKPGNGTAGSAGGAGSHTTPPPPPSTTTPSPLQPTPPYRLRSPMQTLVKQYRGSCIANKAMLQGETLCEYYSHSPHEVRQRVGVIALETAIKTFKKLKFKPSIQQRQVLTWIFRICAKFVLCLDFRSESHRLFREWGIAKESSILGYLAMRRGGKTELSGAGNGDLLFFSDYGLNEACFSTQQAISNLFVATVARFFIEFCEIMGHDPRRRIISSSASRFCVTKYSHYDSNISHAQLYASGNYNDCVGLSGNITGQKGRRINIMNLDECSRIPFKIIRESAAPHMTTGSVVIATSTTMGTDDPFTSLFHSDDPYANEVMALFQMKNMCDDCQERGIPPQLCTHMDHLAPSWLDPEKRKLAELLIQDTNIAAREIRGVAFNDDISGIPDNVVDRLFNVLPRVSVREWLAGHTTSLSLDGIGDQVTAHAHASHNVAANDIDSDRPGTMFDHEFTQPDAMNEGSNEESKLILFSFVDIGGYSRTNDSETSVSTIMWMKKGQLAVLVGCAGGNMPHINESRRFLQHYFLTFMTHKLYRDATHVIAVENNYGGSAFTADAIAELIRVVLPNMIDICEKPPKIGVGTNQQTKCDAAVTFIDLIMFDGLRIAREEDFVTVAVDAIGAVNSVLMRGAQHRRGVNDEEVQRELSSLGLGKDAYAKLLDEMSKQLKRLKRSRTNNGGSAYSGKGKNGSGMRDDHYMTWSASILWSKKFLERVVMIREVQLLGRVFLKDMEAAEHRRDFASHLI